MFATSRFDALPVALAFATGVIASLALAAYAYRAEVLDQRQSFARRTDHSLIQVTRDMREALQALRQTNQLFTAVPDLSRAQFALFAQPILSEFPYIAALGYHRLVRHAQRAAAPVRPQYQVIDYAVPAGALGLDAGDDAGERAARSGLPAASEAFPLAGERQGELGFRLLSPHYLAAPARHQPMLAGYTSAIILPKRLFDTILASIDSSTPSAVAIRVYSGRAADPATQVYGPAAPTPRTPCWMACAPLSMARTYDWAGKAWHVTIHERPKPPLDAHLGSLSLLLAGLLTTLWVTATLRSQRSLTRRVVKLVELRTGELLRLNQILLSDIEARRHTQDELEKSRTELRALAEHHAKVKEEERKRIAREIHDDLGQSMLALRIDLSLMAAGDPGKITGEQINHALVQIDVTMGAMRMIINELRPAVLDLGLDAAVRWETTKFQRRTGIACELDIRLGEAAPSDDMTTAMYRIVQESLTNIMRHAQASQVRLALWSEQDWLFMTIADNGVGMQEQCRRKSKSFGLIGISERIYALGGAFDTESEPGAGTKLTIAIPFSPVDGSARA